MATAAALTAALMLAAPVRAAETTLKFIPQADLRILDPIWTTAYITRNYAYMVYDTLLGIDSEFKIQPQMAEGWKLSDDKLTYTFTLRDGLKWHDGAPVRAADCVASLQRWMKRDGLGQSIAENMGEMNVVDDRSFTIVMKRPFPLLLDGLAKLSSSPAFMMPERVAKTDANTQIAEAVGSGPFKFLKDEWRPGAKAVFVKNADYVPRKEPPSWTAGGKVVKFDRVEWDVIPDTQTAANALGAGEEDWWEQVPGDLVPLLEKNKSVTVATPDPLGAGGILRFNQLQPPFNNAKMRQAMLYAVDQKEFMQAAAGDQKFWRTCYSYFPCGTPLASDAGNGALAGKRDLDKAKALIKEAGYAGERIVVMAPTDQPVLYPQALVFADTLKKLGLNVDLQAMDWSTLITRRSLKDGVDKNGWSAFFTFSVAPDFLSPPLNASLRAGGEKAWFGWPDDPKLEDLRAQWMLAPDQATQKKTADEIQAEAFQSVPYIPSGQFLIPTAFRKNLEGVLVAPMIFLWNVHKT